MAGPTFDGADSGKLAWITPAMSVVVTVSDVAADIGNDPDEDFSGLS